MVTFRVEINKKGKIINIIHYADEKATFNRDGTIKAVGDIQYKFFVDGDIQSIGDIPFVFHGKTLSSIGNAMIRYSADGDVTDVGEDPRVKVVVLSGNQVSDDDETDRPKMFLQKPTSVQQMPNKTLESTCEHCGIVYTKGEKFCSECGNALKTAERQAEEQAQLIGEIVQPYRGSAAGMTIIAPNRNPAGGMTIFFGIIGVFIGIPVSYYFQNPIVRKVPLIEYIKHIPEIIKKPDPTLGDLATPVILTCAVCAFIMGIVGYFIANSGNK